MTNDPLGLFDNEDKDPLGLFTEEKSSEDGVSFLKSYKRTISDELDRVGHYAKDVGKRVVDPETYKEAGRQALQGLEDAGQTVGNFVTGGRVPASAPQEVAANLGTNTVGFAAAPIPAAMQSLNNVSQGQPANFEQNYSNAIDRMTYQPKNPDAQRLVDQVGAAINSVGIPTMGLGATLHPPGMSEAQIAKYREKNPSKSLVDDVVKKQAELDAAKAAEKPTSVDPLGLADELKQMDLLEPDNQGKSANPYEAQHGTWAVDENGMPVRTDISMEAANLEQPLQKNLWGDELAPRETPVGQATGLPMDRDIMGHEQLTGKDVSPDQIGMTQAMDNTRRGAFDSTELPDAVAKREEMQQQIDMLSHDLKSGPELERAKMDAEVQTPRSPFSDPTISSMGKFSRQRGAVAPKEIYEAASRGVEAAWNKVQDLWNSVSIHHREGFDAMDHLDPRNPAMVNFVRQELHALGYGEHMNMALMDLLHKAKDYEKAHDSFNMPMEIKGKYNIVRKALENIETQIADLHAKMEALHPLEGLEGRAYYEKFDAMDRGTKARWRNLANKINELEAKKEKIGLTPAGEKILKEKGITSTSSADYATMHADMAAARDALPQTGGGSNGNIVPLRQRGAIGNLSKGKKSRTIIDDLKARYEKDTNLIPKDPDPKTAVKEALADGKDNKQWNYTESGATLAAMKRRSPAVLAASRIVQNAQKRADLAIRENVFPVEKAFRNLSKEEITSLASLMKMEMLKGKRFEADALSSLSVKQQVAYAHMRHMFEDTLRIQNEARDAKGQAPITEMEAYLSSRWNGDFRRPVFQAVLDKHGNPIINPDGSIQKKLVYYLAADTKRGLETQWKALKKDHPDLEFDPKEDHTVRYYKRQTDLQSMYSTLLDILGRDDPAVKKITDAVKEQTINEAATFLGQEKHFKEKSGVRGFVGDRPGRDGHTEALAMFQQQIQYAKNAYKWSELQTAGEGIKEIVSDKDLVKQQPNNVKYIKEYYKNNVGYGEAAAISHLEDAIRNLGVSPTILDHAVGGVKSFFILQKLMVNTGFAIANLVQTANTIPHLFNLLNKGYGGNVLTALPIGILSGIATATGHYVSYAGLGQKGKLFGHLPDSAFINRAFKYAEDNGVASRALYDEAPIETSFSKVGQAANIAGKTMSVPEAFVRSMSYMTAVQWLKDSKKFSNDIELFQKAEEITNASMVDYRKGERPMMFEKLGTIGNFLNTLQTYPMNYYNQWNFAGREALKGNVGPFLAMIAVQYAVAGASGMPGFEDMTKLWDFMKDHLPATTYAKYRDSDFFTDPKMWMVKNFGQSSVYGVLSDKSGIGLTSRASTPGAGQMIQAPGGPIVDLAGQAMNLGSAVLDPTNKTKWAQSAMSSSPPGVQGLVETSPAMEGTMWDNRTKPDGSTERIYGRPGNVESHTGVVTRTPQEETLRKWGLRSQRETVERELGYRYDKNLRVAEEKAKSIPDAMYDAAKRGNKAEVADLYSAYIKLTGKEISKDAWDAQVKQNYMTTVERANVTANKSVTALKDVARMNAILDEVRNEYQQRR